MLKKLKISIIKQLLGWLTFFRFASAQYSCEPNTDKPIGFGRFV